MSGFWTIPSAAIMAVALCLSSPGEAQGPGRTAHITVQVRRLSGDPIRSLQNRDFAVTGDGVGLPVTVVKPSAVSASPVSVLVLCSPRSSVRTAADAVALLKATPQSRLLHGDLALRLADGTVTPYSSVASLAIPGGALIQPSDRVTAGKALDVLGHRVGRRAIVYIVGAYDGVPPDLVRAADAIGALIYQVGGDTGQNFVFEGTYTTTGALPVYGAGLNGNFGPPEGGGFHVVNNTQIWESHATQQIRTVHVEKSLGGAFHDIRADGRGWYDLLVQLPPTPAAHLHLTLPHEHNFQITAEIEAGDGARAPELSVGTP